MDEPRGIMLSEITHTEKGTSYDFTNTWNLKKTKQTESRSQTYKYGEQIDGWQRGVRMG